MITIDLPIKYSQFDPLWSKNLLGFNTDPKYDLYNFGCLVTSIAMVLRYYGIDETPASLNDKLKAVEGFTDGGLYVHGAVSKIYPHIQEKNVQMPKEPLTNEQMTEIKMALQNKQPVIFGLDYNPKTLYTDYHFAVVVGYNETDENDFTLADPLGARVHSLKNYLGWYRPSARNSISSYFIYTNTSLPQEQIIVTDPVTIEPEVPQAETPSIKTPEISELPEISTSALPENYANIVHGSTQWDQVVAYLEFDKPPKDVTFENVKRIIAGIKSRQTDLDQQREKALKESVTLSETIKNLQMDLSSREKEVLQSEKLHRAEILNLKQSQPNFDKLTTQYQSVINELREDNNKLLEEVKTLRVELGHKNVEQTSAHEELLATLPKPHPIARVLHFLFKVRV